MKYISESCPHRYRLLIQNIPATGTHSLSGKLCSTIKTFSLSDFPLFLSACPSPHIPHIREGLSLPCEYDLSACCIPLSRNTVSFISPPEKVSANTLALQNLGRGSDTSESKRYDTPHDRHCGLNILFPPHPLNYKIAASSFTNGQIRGTLAFGSLEIDGKEVIQYKS